MLQIVATFASLALAASALAVIVVVLAADWRSIMGAFAPRGSFEIAPLPRRTRPAGDRRAHVVRISSQSAPRHAAA